MIQIDLSRSEREILVQVLEADLSDLRMEIAHTDLLEYREGLKDRKRVLSKVLEALRQEAA
jgi:hypothetical protein